MVCVSDKTEPFKDSLVKVLEENPRKWPDVIVVGSIIFSHHISIHSSNKCSLFHLMFNLQSTLPIDVKYDLNCSINDDDPYDYETFGEVFK